MSEILNYNKTVGKSESKHRLISKCYILSSENNGGGAQASYNLPNEFIEKMKEKNILLKKETMQATRNNNDNEIYYISEEYEVILDESIIKYIGYSPTKKIQLFITMGNGNKPQLRHTTYTNLKSNLEYEQYDLEWFKKLYFSNFENNVMNYSLNLISKKLVISLTEHKYTSEEVVEEKEDIKTEIPTNTIQTIYYGAPGTGKSYGVSKLIKQFYDIDEKENPYVFRTTIYQDYSYYDFIGNIMPENIDGRIEYIFKPGPFTLALTKAFENPNTPIFLVIEEMSRGNIASIFGDIFQLLDRKNGVSEYSITNSLVSKYILSNVNTDDVALKNEKIYLPQNLNIVGTVNTSDQNVNVIDTAFKRRFSFVYSSVSPVRDEENNIKNENTFKFNLKIENGEELEFEWIRFYMALNKFIKLNLELSEDKQIGEFFIKFSDNFEENYDSIKNKLLHYLWEDVMLACINERVSIFKDDIKTFAKLYRTFEEKENIFSNEFINMYKNDLVIEISKLDESYI